MSPRLKPETPWDRVTVRLSPQNHEWLRERAHRERKSQALVLNEVLTATRKIPTVEELTKAMNRAYVGYADGDVGEDDAQRLARQLGWIE